jgi:hypothetical protein
VNGAVNLRISACLVHAQTFESDVKVKSCLELVRVTPVDAVVMMISASVRATVVLIPVLLAMALTLELVAVKWWVVGDEW